MGKKQQKYDLKKSMDFGGMPSGKHYQLCSYMRQKWKGCMLETATFV